MELLNQSQSEFVAFRNEIERRSGLETSVVVDTSNEVYNIYSLRNGQEHSIMAVVGYTGIKTGMIYIPKNTFSHGSAQGTLFSNPLGTLSDSGRVKYININTPRVHIEHGEV